MSNRLRWLTWSAALMLALAAPGRAAAQGNPDPFGFKFNTGQSVQPIFEGWAKNPDGTFAMYFGYLNRNYVETPEIPVGPENKIEPGAPDSGQPTFFYSRIRRKAFSVTVPKDWGKKELTWTVTAHGVTEKAVAWLQPEWEIDPVYGGKTRTEESLKNTPPAMTLEVPSTVMLPNKLTLTANVKDDGLPKPRGGAPRRAAVGQETPPSLKPLPDQSEVPVNVPSIGGGRGRGGPAPRGLLVNWMVWRGPAAATFASAAVQVTNGKAVTTATFTKPGTYVLRAVANDGELTDQKDVTVRVTGTSQP